MIIHIILGGLGGDQSHIVERRHQDTAIESEEMHVAVKFGVNGGVSFTAILGRLGAEPIFGTIAESFDDPRQFKFLDDRLQRLQ